MLDIIPHCGGTQEQGKIVTIAWIVLNTVHYHVARWRRVAELPGFRAHLVAVRGIDEINVLEARPGGFQFPTHVLFPSGGQLLRHKVSRMLRITLDKIDPDVVCINGWSLYGSWEALNWCLVKRRRAILMSETNEHDCSRPRITEWIKSRFVRLCSAAIVGGKQHASYLARLGMDTSRIWLGYDTIDNDHFSIGARAARRDARRMRSSLELPDRYILACARFTAKKNLATVISSYAQYLRQAGPGAPKLVILGDGPLRSQLEDLTAALCICNQVEFRGFKPYDVLPAYYALAELFVHASTVEQWGLVVNESMASGTPVLVSSSCGAAELVTDGVTGYTFNPKHKEELATLMYKVSSDAVHRRSLARNCCHLISNWTPARFASAIRSATGQVLGTAPRHGVFDRIIVAGACWV